MSQMISKVRQTDKIRSQQSAPAHQKGTSVSPPSYGIDFVDYGMKNNAKTSNAAFTQSLPTKNIVITPATSTPKTTTASTSKVAVAPVTTPLNTAKNTSTASKQVSPSTSVSKDVIRDEQHKILPPPTLVSKSAALPNSSADSASAKFTDKQKADVPNNKASVAPAIAAVQNRASGSSKHSAPAVSVSSAQAAAINPKTEQNRSAATQTVANLDATKTEEIKRNEFKSNLKRAIAEATPQPKNESDAEKVIKTGATQASSKLRGQLATEKNAATGAMQTASSTEVPASSQPAPQAVNLQSEPVGQPPAPVSAAPVVPAPLPAERLDYSSDRGSTNQMMVQNNVTNEQLQEGNDPAFSTTIEARSTAEKNEATAETKYRQGESKVQEQTKATATQALAKDLAGIHGIREQQIGKVVAQQLSTKGKDAQERQNITDKINSIKNTTRKAVDDILNSLEKEASEKFEAGLKSAEKAYEDTFDEAKGGIGTWLTTWGSDWDKLIEKSLATARTEYLKQVDVAIDTVATLVDDKVKTAKQKVADARKEVENYVKGLGASVKEFGEEALKEVSNEFDTMGNDIEQRRDGLINKLTDQYKASYERMSAMENKLREENKSLWQRVYDATVGLIKKILEFKDMLLSILSRAVSVIGDIIAHPIRFLGNLVSGVMLGLKNFMSKIGTYLMKGIMDWLFGALAGAGLQLPDKFDLQGIISIVLQILGLTYANFRARAVAIVGEPVVAAIEKTAEVFKVLLTEGVSGLWRLIQEQLTNLKTMVLDAIFDYLKEKIIIAGITWIIGLLNPASAFFKACKAIYDIVMFFVNRGSQILSLVNAVIDSMASIAKGDISVAAVFVENALAKAIPVAIGFLASLLGLGDPSKPIRGFIDKAQAPVNKAIDWVINLAVKGVKAIGKFAKGKAEQLKEWWKQRTSFTTASGEKHEVYFVGNEKNAVPMVASNDPQPIKDKLEEFKRLAKDKKATKKQKEADIDTTLKILQKNPDDPKIISDIKKLFDIFYEKSPIKKTVYLKQGQTLSNDPTKTLIGMYMRVDWLSYNYIADNKGSPPGSGQDQLMNRLVTDPTQSSPDKYIRGHLLNENLAGKGENVNLFPITGNANSQHLRSTEKYIKDWVAPHENEGKKETEIKKKHYAMYEVEVHVKNYELNKSKIESNFVDSIFKCKVDLKDEDGQIDKTFQTDVESEYGEKHKTEKPY